MEECRISVRELVEFTHHGEDIRPGGGLRDMQEGMLGHKARQRLLGDTWTAEKPVFIEIPVQDPEPWRLVVGGRMGRLAGRPALRGGNQIVAGQGAARGTRHGPLGTMRMLWRHGMQGGNPAVGGPPRGVCGPSGKGTRVL